MYELRSTRVRTDRVLSVPGTDFLCRLPPVRPQIASIPARLGQVPGTDFQSGRRLLASRRVLGQVPGVLGRCLAPTSTWHRFPPGTDLAAVSIRSGRSPKLRVLGRCLAPTSSPAADCYHPAASWAGAWHRFGRIIDTLGSEPQATVDPPRRMPGVLGAPGTGFLVLTDRTD